MGGEETIAILLALPATIVALLLHRNGLLQGCCGCAGTKRLDARHRAILAKPDPAARQPHEQPQPSASGTKQQPEAPTGAAVAEAEAAAAAAAAAASEETSATTRRIVLAAGCFWGVQLAFQRVPGVSGRSGHAEAVEVEYDPAVISLQELFVVFFSIHNPTTLNRQGNDVGTQYRSAIFFDGEQEKVAAQTAIDAETERTGTVLSTRLEHASRFWRAESYHQRYLEKRGQSAETGCTAGIRCYG